MKVLPHVSSFSQILIQLGILIVTFYFVGTIIIIFAYAEVLIL